MVSGYECLGVKSGATRGRSRARRKTRCKAKTSALITSNSSVSASYHCGAFYSLRSVTCFAPQTMAVRHFGAQKNAKAVMDMSIVT